MNIIEILNIHKLPLRIVILLTIVIGLLLFIPLDIKVQLGLDDFTLSYRKYLGAGFIFCFGLTIFGIAFKLFNRYKSILTMKNKIYSELLIRIGELLLLDQWVNLVDNAVRGLMPLQFYNNQEHFNRLMLVSIWPKHNKKIRQRIKNLNDLIEDVNSKLSDVPETFRNKYLIEDHLGVWNGGEPIIDLPKKLPKYDIREWVSEHER